MLQFLIPVLLTLFTTYTFYYILFCIRKPILIYNKKSEKCYWQDKTKIPQLLQKYWFPPFIIGCSHLQNLFYEGIILKSKPIKYNERIFLKSDDGGVFALDLLYPDYLSEADKLRVQKSKNLLKNNDDKNIFDDIIFIYPGYTGKSPDAYIKRLCHICKGKKFNNKNILIAVMIQRGYDGLKLSNDKINAVTNITDLRVALKYLDVRFNTEFGDKSFNLAKDPQNNIYLTKNNNPKLQDSGYQDFNNNFVQTKSIIKICAFSFGAMQTRLLLGANNTAKEEENSTWYPKAALCNSCPFDLHMTTFKRFEVLYSGLFYNRILCKRISQFLLKHDLIKNQNMLSQCKVIRHIDDQIIAPMWGFKGWSDFYTAASITEQACNNIKVPTIFLNSQDDPLINDIPKIDKWFENSNNILLAKSACGGHCAFLRFGWLLKSSTEQQTYFEELFEHWLGMNF